jgi:hypothetical protein
MNMPGFSAERSLDSDWRGHWITSDVHRLSDPQKVTPQAAWYRRCWEDERRQQSVCEIVWVKYASYE